jgi:putative NAD(P)-binding protein
VRTPRPADRRKFPITDHRPPTTDHQPPTIDKEHEVHTMKIALTGSTGFIGSHILSELTTNGHTVTALVQGDDQAQAVRSRGAEPAIVDLYDQVAVTKIFETADGAVHTASPGDETSAGLDSAVVDAAIAAYGSSGKPYVHISGLWIYGSNLDVTERSTVNAPAMVAWKEPIQERLLGVRHARRGRCLERCLWRRGRRHPGTSPRLTAR